MSDAKRFLISEVCEKLGVEKQFVIHCIRAHWVRPVMPETAELDEEDLARLKLIWELREDFGVNEEALPIILHLLDQVYYLRQRIQDISNSAA